MITTLAQMNAYNREISLAQQRETERRSANRELLFAARACIDAEFMMGKPIAFQTSWDAALEMAETKLLPPTGLDAAARRELGRMGGRAKKQNTLNQLLLGWLRKNPEMKEAELRKFLKKEEGGDIIHQVTRDEIVYFDHKGTERSATKSGLPNRLSRLRKKIP